MEVTNERQTLRTVVSGVDEVQTITTTCDDVVNEVQTVTTTAIDKDEVQTFAMTATDVDEIQIVRTSATSVAEVQRVDVSVEEIDEVQILGIFIEGIDTSSCTSINAEQVGRECSAIETKLSGNFQLYFDVEACGDQTGTDLTNWCAAAIAENHPDWGIDMDSLVDWTPCSSGSQCQTGTLTITSTAEEVADELNNLYYEVSGIKSTT